MVIEFSHVYKSFGELDVLFDISFLIREGEMCGIIGLSGAGKTTILRLISGLEFAEKGTITVANKEVRVDFVEDFRNDMSIVFQGYNLLMQSNVYDNIAFPLKIRKMKKEEIKNRVEFWAEKLGILDKLYEYPSHLSGGQKQRVAIARALVIHPKILLLDEPTSALDVITAKNILDILRNLNKEIDLTVIIITHDVKVVKSLERIIVIDKGRKVFDDKVEHLEQSDNILVREILA